MAAVLQYVLYLALLVVIAIPLGVYIKKVMYGEKTFLSKALTPCENLVYKVIRVKKEEDMGWKKYLASVLIFSGMGFIFLFLLLLLQGFLPGNPQNLPGTSWHLAFNTASSFVTNTNWQAYSGEATLSYLTQALGLTVQNFVSAATGMAVLFALIRGFTKVKERGLGSFWVDMTRIVVHILLPLNLVMALCLVGGGVVQSLRGADTVQLLEPMAVNAEGEILENAVIDHCQMHGWKTSRYIRRKGRKCAQGKPDAGWHFVIEGGGMGIYLFRRFYGMIRSSLCGLDI